VLEGWWHLLVPLAFPIYLLAMGGVLRLIGVPKAEVVKRARPTGYSACTLATSVVDAGSVRS
jgi:hypothetical protein